MKKVKQNVASIIEINRGNENFYFSISIIEKEDFPFFKINNFLHPSEKEVFNSFKYERRKQSYALGRISAKLAVKKISQIEALASINIDSGIFGFPIVKCSEAKNVQVSISHSDTLGISIAFKESHPMGIDIEKINSDREKVLYSQISNNELELLQLIKEDNLYGYTTLWCAKEAMSKIIKTGMMLDFNFLEIKDIVREEETLCCTFKNFGQYKALCYSNNKYAIALVLPKNSVANMQAVWKDFNSKTGPSNLKQFS